MTCKIMWFDTYKSLSYFITSMSEDSTSLFVYDRRAHSTHEHLERISWIAKKTGEIYPKVRVPRVRSPNCLPQYRSVRPC
jgi:hypothetical protein